MENVNRRKRTKPRKHSSYKARVKEEMIIEGDDRISLLPEPIIHHILLLLPSRYAAKTSALSKKWYSIWSTFPVINLNEKDFIKYFDVESESRGRFVHCLQLTHLRRSLTNLDMLKINTEFPGNSCKLYQVVNELVEKSMKGNLKNLDLKFAQRNHYLRNEVGRFEDCYKLPQTLFLFGQSLVSLKVEGCNFLGHDKNLGVSFNSLKSLSIINTHIEGIFLEKLVHGCLAIELLYLKSCHELKGFEISHCKMETCVFEECTDLEECRIDAPSLQSFKYLGYSRIVGEPGNLRRSISNTPNCTFKFSSLLYLYLQFVSMKGDTLSKMISTFPKLQSIKVKDSIISEKSQIFGNELTNLEIENCMFGGRLECRAANLEAVTFIRSVNLVKISAAFLNLSSISFIRINELTCEDIQLALRGCRRLRSMDLISCDNLDYIKILSGSLESLVIRDCANMKDVRILAHTLKFFKYSGPILKFSRLLTSNKLVVDLNVKCTNQNHLEKFLLRDFLQMFSQTAESITFRSDCDECKDMLEH